MADPVVQKKGTSVRIQIVSEALWFETAHFKYADNLFGFALFANERGDVSVSQTNTKRLEYDM